MSPSLSTLPEALTVARWQHDRASAPHPHAGILQCRLPQGGGQCEGLCMRVVCELACLQIFGYKGLSCLAEQFSRGAPPPPPQSGGLTGITRQRVGLPLKIRVETLLLLSPRGRRRTFENIENTENEVFVNCGWCLLLYEFDSCSGGETGAQNKKRTEPGNPNSESSVARTLHSSVGPMSARTASLSSDDQAQLIEMARSNRLANAP